jgi:hemoglobin
MLARAIEPGRGRQAPNLTFVASVVIRLDAVQSMGETPDGVRLHFNVQGTVDGPSLKGRFPPCSAHLVIDRDGIGTIHVRAPLLLDDGASAELEATGRYDFGPDGYRRAVAGDLPDSSLGWCPRLSSAHPRYQWLNRTLCLGVGELRPREKRVDYDLYAIASIAPEHLDSPALDASSARTLYQRLGGRDAIEKIMGGFIDALHEDAQLNRQNPRIAEAMKHVSPVDLKRKVVDFVCRITGGPCEYRGRPMSAVHAPLAISEADWAIAVEGLRNVLAKYEVGGKEQDELLAAIGTVKPDIVRR